MIVILPITVLGWFGLRTVEHEQAAIAHQLQNLTMIQLKSIDETIQRLFLDRQALFLQDVGQLDSSIGTEILREYAQNSIYAHHVLLMDAEGKRLFPPDNQPLSEAEHSFLERTAAIWDNPRRLTQSAPIPVISTANSASFGSFSEALPNNFGWYAWYWEVELHHLFWVRTSNHYIIGFELDPVRLTSDLISILPASGDMRDAASDALIRLRDNNGTIIYQWGSYQPSETEPSMVMLPLSHPLGSWKLEYYRSTQQALGQANRFALGSGVLAVALVLIGLGYYLYREQSREMSLASQRVNFVNQVSHELKTPLTNIRLYAELLEDELPETDQKASKYLQVITLESRRLSRLITNVLNFARAQRKHLQLQLKPGVVDETLHRCLETFQPALAAHSVAIRWKAHASMPVMLDEEILEQILNNLLSNVEKYGVSGGALEIESQYEHDRTRITIRDFGPGIPAAERDRIFQPFYRISSKLTDGITGTGIGLGIVRELAQLHGGDVTLLLVERGACFEVSLATSATLEAS